MGKNFSSKKKISNSALRKVLFLLALITFALTLPLNYTGAWFTDSVTHISVLQFGSVDIEIEVLGEEDGMLNLETQDLMPGNSFERTLSVSNPETSEPAYMRMRTAFLINDGSGYKETQQVVKFLQSGEGANWTQASDPADGQGSSYWFYYNNVLGSDEDIQIPIVLNIYPLSPSGDVGLGNSDSGNDFRIDIIIETVQYANEGYQKWDGEYPSGWPS